MLLTGRAGVWTSKPDCITYLEKATKEALTHKPSLLSFILSSAISYQDNPNCTLASFVELQVASALFPDNVQIWYTMFKTVCQTIFSSDTGITFSLTEHLQTASKNEEDLIFNSGPILMKIIEKLSANGMFESSETLVCGVLKIQFKKVHAFALGYAVHHKLE
jgi:hypothetical protein